MSSESISTTSELEVSRRVDLSISIVIVAVGVWLLVAAQTIRHGSIDDPLREGGVPSGVAILLIVGGAALAVGQLRAWKSSAEVHAGVPDDPAHGPASALRAGAVFVSLVLYALAMPILGFVIATPLFMVSAMWLLGVRSLLKLLGPALGFTLVGYLFFGILVGVRLPPGVFRIGV